MRRLSTGMLIFSLGLGLGIYAQHRWPIGRWRDERASRPTVAGRTVAEIAQIPRERRLVILAVGQSNAANFGETKQTAGPGVYAFADGSLYAATDPLPGGNGYGGSIWTRLGARLHTAGDFDAVVLAVVARGSTRVTDWAPGGADHERLVATQKQLTAAGLPVDCILWQQGETEAGWADASGVAYFAALKEIISACRTASPDAKFVVAQATFGAASPSNGQISPAQTQAAALPGAMAGPDLDRLGSGFRSDGVHFNDRGLAAAADAWLAALRPWLTQRSTTLPR